MPTLKEIEKTLGLSAEWIKKMGKIGVFDFIQNDPGTPGVPRTLNDQEMYTVFRYASYRQAGYPLEKLKEHAKKAKRLREIFLKYKTRVNVLTKRKIPSVDASVFTLIGAYTYRDPELTNIYPEELVNITKKDLSEINEIIAWFAAEAQKIEKLIEEEQERIKLVSTMLEATGKNLNMGQISIKSVARFFKSLEEGK